MRIVNVTLQAKEALLFLAANPPQHSGNFECYEPCVFVPQYEESHGKSLFVGEGSRVDSFCKLEAGLGLVIGQRVHVASFCHIGLGGGLTIIGDGVGISSHVVICSGTNTMDGKTMSAADDCTITRDVTEICRGAFLGAGCIVMPGVRVGENAVVAAGALVRENVPDNAVVMGVPAHVRGYR